MEFFRFALIRKSSGLLRNIWKYSQICSDSEKIGGNGNIHKHWETYKYSEGFRNIPKHSEIFGNAKRYSEFPGLLWLGKGPKYPEIMRNIPKYSEVPGLP